MFRQVSLVRVCFAASVALERLLPRVRPHVALQLTRRSGSKDALVTLEWLFASVLSLMCCQGPLFAQLLWTIFALKLEILMRLFMRSEMGQISTSESAMFALKSLICGVVCSLVLYAT